MKKIVEKIKGLTTAKKIQLCAACVLSVALLTAIPVYAWFTSQRKAAEMYKIEYPNSLYINAAHREDQIYFELDAVNVNEFEKDSDGKVIYYTDSTYTNPKTINVDGKEIYDTNGVAKIITSQKYVFSVFGTNTDKFKLQLSYTNNNQFKYNLYEADEKTKEQFDNLSPTSVNYVVRSANGAGSHTASSTVFSDDINLNDKDVDYYYVYGSTSIQGSYLNAKQGSNNLLADNSGKYYSNNYSDNTNVEEKSIPIYWQSEELNADTNSNKLFCKYYVLEVTWDSSRVAEKKETDMIAIAVKRQ